MRYFDLSSSVISCIQFRKKAHNRDQDCQIDLWESQYGEALQHVCFASVVATSFSYFSPSLHHYQSTILEAEEEAISQQTNNIVTIIFIWRVEEEKKTRLERIGRFFSCIKGSKSKSM